MERRVRPVMTNVVDREPCGIADSVIDLRQALGERVGAGEHRDRVPAAVGVLDYPDLVANPGQGAAFVGPPQDVVRTMAEDIGAMDAADFARRYPELTAQEVYATRALDPRRTRSTGTGSPPPFRPR